MGFGISGKGRCEGSETGGDWQTGYATIVRFGNQPGSESRVQGDFKKMKYTTDIPVEAPWISKC
jgi:hypothetical protein